MIDSNKTHYLDELPNMDKDVLAKMWKATLPNKLKNMTGQELITFWKQGLESERIQLDNLDWAKLVFDKNGEVVVRNEHGTQFPVSDLSENEIDIFHANI